LIAEIIDGLPVDSAMADTAHEAGHSRQAIAAKGALAAIPNRSSRS
jgi:hypothetical protein